jgi:hypothetical protein
MVLTFLAPPAVFPSENLDGQAVPAAFPDMRTASTRSKSEAACGATSVRSHATTDKDSFAVMDKMTVTHRQ